MKELDCYFVGHITSGSDEIKLAEPVRPHNMAVSFTESLGEFFFNFAEKHFRCEKGDEILLMSASVDCSDLEESEFVDGFKQRTEACLEQKSGEIIKRRIAIASDSTELSARVRMDLYEKHRLIMQQADVA